MSISCSPSDSYKANTYYSSGSVFCDLFADAEEAVVEEAAAVEEKPAVEEDNLITPPRYYAYHNAPRYGARYGRYAAPAKSYGYYGLGAYPYAGHHGYNDFHGGFPYGGYGAH